MKRNMGGVDKLVRLIVALIIILAYFNNTIEGILGIILLIIAGIFIVTSLISFCPLYAVFGIDTSIKKKKK